LLNGRIGIRASVILVSALCLSILPPAIEAQRHSGSVGKKVAPRTDAGEWYGTWYYVFRDGKYALWMRMQDGKPQAKLQFFSTTSPEGFETDWSGNSEYQVKRGKGKFSLIIDEGDENVIAGRWEWELDFGGSARVETGKFDMWRAADGRQIVLNFSELNHIRRRGEEQEVFSSAPTWSFRKASNRLVLWDELPF